MAWMCPACGRQFARQRQGHDCAPAMSIDEYFSTGPSFERPVFDGVTAVLEQAGPVHVDAVSVGIFLKNPRKFAELRPRQKWVAISFSLRRVATHRTITRKVVPYNNRYWHVANVTTADDVDDALGALLLEAYDEAASDEAASSSGRRGGRSTRAIVT